MRTLKVHDALFSYDSALRSEYPIICGIDEAGRGPLAGDVYAAAVILPEGVVIPGLNDSKKISEKNRERIYEEICEKAVAYAVASVGVEEIERLNILGAAMLAMEKAYMQVSEKMAADCVLVDGNRLPNILNAKNVVHGDAVSASIAAASILAKVSRDKTMYEADEKYPEYGFAAHKGYGTKAHTDAILTYGVTPIHRPSFLKKLEEKYGPLKPYETRT